MTIIRTPRPLEPDTRRAVLDGHLGPADLAAPTVGRRRLESIRARVARCAVAARGDEAPEVELIAQITRGIRATEPARMAGDCHPESGTVFCQTGLIDRRVAYDMLWLVPA